MMKEESSLTSKAEFLPNAKMDELRPYIISVQKMVLYETKNKFFLVGSNQSETKFRILKIDRTEPREFLVEDEARYSNKEMKELLSTIASINRRTSPGGLARTVSAFGILGFVRFLEGYYIVLITKRRKVATIGFHSIYKIEDTACIYIPNEGSPKHQDEIRYVKLFQSLDLSSNFYFAYSYDLTNSLQYNMAEPKHATPGYNISNPELYSGYGMSSVPNMKFVWNGHLLNPMRGKIHPDWILNVVHGFIGQSNLSIYGKPIYLTLIARRSSKYAGTRFLKRGANFEGNVANEVETEQIVFDGSVSAFERGKFTSFVQMRGSIPAHWSQDTAKMVPKPPIGIDLPDPFAETSGKHFCELLNRFGSPIFVLNLVKKRERKRHESILTEEYVAGIRTMNQFLPNPHKIHYVGFDMAKTNKMKEVNVMTKLASIAEEAFTKTGFFQSFKSSTPSHASEKLLIGKRQTGLVRVNCVDCLDRTNTAQFAIGKCGLDLQLKALNVLNNELELEYDTDVTRMLEELYEDHGDTLALQYGGSQLVHRINTYRKTAPWTSQGNDIMQTMSRYYSNTFSDADKQNAINLFLGVFKPSKETCPLWSLDSDIHLHLKICPRFTNRSLQELRPLTETFRDEVVNALPRPCHEVEKRVYLFPCEDTGDVDTFMDFYRPHYFVQLCDVYAFKISHSVRDFMPNFTTDYSPFAVRIRPGKRQEETSKKSKLTFKNPSIMGLSSTGSSNSTSSDTDYSSSEEMNSSLGSSSIGVCIGKSSSNHLHFSNFFLPMKESYGVELKNPRKSDLLLYKRFVNFQQLSDSCQKDAMKNNLSIPPLTVFSKDSSFNVTPPTVSRISRDIYRNYVKRGIKGSSLPSKRDMGVYTRYMATSGKPKCQAYQ